MKNTIIRNLIIIAITLLSFFIVNNSNCVLAAAASHSGGSGGGSSGGKGDIAMSTELNPDYYKPNSQTNAADADKIKNIGNVFVEIIQIVGSILSVIILVIIGIKYMTGSVEEKAEYKQSLMPYLIGAFILFGISNILSIIVNMVSGLTQ